MNKENKESISFADVLEQYKKFNETDGEPVVVFMIAGGKSTEEEEGKVLRVINGTPDALMQSLKSVLTNTPNLHIIVKQALMEFQYDMEYETAKSRSEHEENKAKE